MPTAKPLLPDTITLNGADYFCLQLDGLMWKASAQRNVCIFAVTLSEPLALADLQRHLDLHPAYQWLCQLRLRQGLPFSLATWRHQPKARVAPIPEYQLEDGEHLPDSVLAMSWDISNGPAFKVILLQLAGAGSRVVFAWHHVLMDARGGELFVRYLGLPPTEKQPEWLADKAVKLPLKVRATIASEMKQFLYDTSVLPLLTLYQKKPAKPQLRYRVLRFTPAQTLAINARATQMAAGFLSSAFYLAATAYAVAAVQQQRGIAVDDVLVPVPLDQRKRGAQGAVLGNQVSFLFYRIPGALLNDIAACTAELIKQMKTLMRTESPQHYSIMMDFLRRLPGLLYRQMLKAPTRGLMASFFYSDTGDSLSDFTSLFGRQVSHAVHYPPNMYPPGMTFVFSRVQGALQLTLGYMQPDLADAEADALLAQLSTALLGQEHG